MDRLLILPPLTRFAKDAEAFARVVHDGQVDKAGKPYIEHVQEVARDAGREFCRAFPDCSREEAHEVRQIGWLHDVIEDTEYTADDLRREGFSEPVISGVMWLTREPADRRPYANWTADLCRHAPLPALFVKLADIEDNSEREREAQPFRNEIQTETLPEFITASATITSAGWGSRTI